MTSRFPIEFFQELVKKQIGRDDAEDFDITLVDGDETEDLNSMEKTIPDRVITLKF